MGVLSVWPQEPPTPPGLPTYAEEAGREWAFRYATVIPTGSPSRHDRGGGHLPGLPRRRRTSPTSSMATGEFFLYSAELRSGEIVRQDQYIRFAAESRPWIDLAPWIPRSAYHWAAVFLLVGFSWTFGRGEVRGALLTIPILAGVLWLIGWLEVSWLLIGAILTLGILVYMRLSEDDLRY